MSWKNNASAVLAALQGESGEQISQVWLQTLQAQHEQVSLQPVETACQLAHCFKAQHGCSNRIAGHSEKE